MSLTFERSDDHNILYNLLSQSPPGDIVTYGQMKEATGRTITGSTGVLHSVLRRLLNDDSAVFACEKRVGYRRLTAAQTVDRSTQDRTALHRHARRSNKKLVTVEVDFATLDEKRRLSYAVGQSLFQALMAATSSRAISMLESHVSRTDMRPLPFAETLAAFGGK